MAKYRTNTASGDYDRKNRFLLLVDNDANNLYYMSMILQRLDYRVTTAENAEEAVAIVTVAEPCLFIVSLELPGLSGIELIQQLKENRSIAPIPIIAIRKQDDLIGEKRCLELGVADCLVYPISAEKLFRAVQTAAETRPRAHIRIRTLLPVKVNNVSPNGLDGTSAVVLSECGLFLPTTRPAPVDTRLFIRLELKKRSITMEALVLYNNHTIGESYQVLGMGVEFCRISPKDQELIRLYIRDEVTRGIMPLND